MSRFVLWSGGCDSTLLLCKQADQYPNEMITAISILEFGNTPEQLKMETKARQKLRKLIQQKNIQYCEIRLSWTTLKLNETTTLPMWFSIIFPYLNNDSTLLLAYLSSDGKDFWLLRESLLQAFNAMCRFRDISAKIEFPFEMKSKGYVINELKKLKIFHHTWYCGQPKKGKPCGKCMKCISVKRWSAYPQRGDDT